MRQVILSSAFIVLAIPAFAQSASTSVGLDANQGTSSMSVVKNGGSGIGGAIAGNYTDVTGQASANRVGNNVAANGNVTATTVGGVVNGAYTKGNAKVISSGSQSTDVTGTASANATVPTQHHRW